MLMRILCFGGGALIAFDTYTHLISKSRLQDVPHYCKGKKEVSRLSGFADSDINKGLNKTPSSIIVFFVGLFGAG